MARRFNFLLHNEHQINEVFYSNNEYVMKLTYTFATKVRIEPFCILVYVFLPEPDCETIFRAREGATPARRT